MNQISVIADAPEFTKGFVKELRIRWAHEEMGLAYTEIKVPHAELKSEKYLMSQPFAQVPYFQSGDLTLFESGAILQYLAVKNNKLIPSEEIPRARAMSWLFAALNSIEPFVAQYFLVVKFFNCNDSAVIKKSFDLVHGRLGQLSKALGRNVHLENEFSIADIVMTTVLRDAYSMKLIEEYPNLIQYKERNEKRPAFAKAFNDHAKLYSS
jgi:glutathione S-transferase